MVNQKTTAVSRNIFRANQIGINTSSRLSHLPPILSPADFLEWFEVGTNVIRKALNLGPEGGYLSRAPVGRQRHEAQNPSRAEY